MNWALGAIIREKHSDTLVVSIELASVASQFF